MKRLAIAASFAIACAESKPPATVTVPLPVISTAVASDTPPALSQPTEAPSADAAPEVLAPGKVTVVHFFASWCAPCAKSLPELEALYASHGGKVAVIGVGEDDDEPDMRAFVARARTSYTVLWDSAKAKASRWRPTTMPTTFVVDKRGMLRFTHAGYHDSESDSLETEVRALLAER